MNKLIYFCSEDGNFSLHGLFKTGARLGKEGYKFQFTHDPDDDPDFTGGGSAAPFYDFYSKVDTEINDNTMHNDASEVLSKTEYNRLKKEAMKADPDTIGEFPEYEEAEIWHVVTLPFYTNDRVINLKSGIFQYEAIEEEDE